MGMRKDDMDPSMGGAPPGSGGEASPSWRSAFDTPLLAGNLAHELTNALFALHLHLDGTAPRNGQRGNGRSGRRNHAGSGAASRTAVEGVLARLDELSRGLRLVARVPAAPSDPEAAERPEPRTILADWWPLARIVVLVSVPKGIDLQVDLPRDLPPVAAEPAELTACTVMMIRRTVGRGRVEPPCTVRLLARPEGRWIRIMAVAHAMSRGFDPDTTAIEPASRDRFLLEEPDPLVASILVARTATGERARGSRLPGKVP